MINFVKIISGAKTLAGVTVKFLRMGRDDVRETEQVTPHGFESVPVKDLVALYATTGQDGDDVIIGYIKREALVDVGESRMFSTDSDGNEQFSIHLKNDGTAEIGGNTDFMVRFNELKAGFDQFKSDFNTHVSNYNTHIHTAPGGATSTPSSISNPTGANIDAAKIDEIKTS